jgi:hypothetical protein
VETIGAVDVDVGGVDTWTVVVAGASVEVAGCGVGDVTGREADAVESVWSVVVGVEMAVPAVGRAVAISELSNQTIADEASLAPMPTSSSFPRSRLPKWL